MKNTEKTGSVWKLNEGDRGARTSRAKVNKKGVAGRGGGIKLKAQCAFSFVTPPFSTMSPMNRITNGTHEVHQVPLTALTEPGRTQISEEALA